VGLRRQSWKSRSSPRAHAGWRRHDFCLRFTNSPVHFPNTLSFCPASGESQTLNGISVPARTRAIKIRGRKCVATVSEFLTVGFSYPHIPNHRGGRPWSQISVFAKAFRCDGRKNRGPTKQVRATRHGTIRLAVKRPCRGCAWQATGGRGGGSNPSSGPRRLVRTPVAVHLLPSEKGGNIARRARARRTVSLSEGRGWRPCAAG
jgi:hypothetical protein